MIEENPEPTGKKKEKLSKQKQLFLEKQKQAYNKIQ